MNSKILLIVILTGCVAAVHLLYTGSNAGFHVLHQQLFFIPIVLASFWFGKGPGLAVAIVISFLYAPAMFLMNHAAGNHLVVFTQVLLYLFVAMLMGWLSDRQRIQQEQLLKGERISTLGKAASTLSFEVRDIVNVIEGIHKKSKGNQSRINYGACLCRCLQQPGQCHCHSYRHQNVHPDPGSRQRISQCRQD